MNLLAIFTKIIEKVATSKLDAAYRESDQALKIFYDAKQRLENANQKLAKTQDDVTSQLSRLDAMSLALDEQTSRNTVRIAKIDAILD